MPDLTAASFTLVDGSPRPGKQSITNERGKIICTFHESAPAAQRRLMAASPRLLAYCLTLRQSYETALVMAGTDAKVIESLPSSIQLKQILAEINSTLTDSSPFLANKE